MIFITGGAGYIGTHTCVELLAAGYAVTVFDNFSNSQPQAISQVERITGKTISLIKGDVRDSVALQSALRGSRAQAVIHFAGLKAVGESVAQPLRYYDHNVTGTLRLLEAMQVCHVKTLVFSSSATVYGNPVSLPLTEDHPLASTSPYGQTKLVIEKMLGDLYRSDDAWHIGMLRYFNPVGAHASGHIGEDPLGVPNNLLPFVAQVAVGRRDCVNVRGNDYATPDGTGVRDYIHVVDLAMGHLAALRQLTTSPQCWAVNLGTGVGHSVLEVLRAFEQASGRPIPFKLASRRPGDVATCYADPDQAQHLLDWRATRGLFDICADTWRWQRQHPSGYTPSD